MNDRPVGARLEDVRERIADAARRAGRDPGSVRLVVVSKNVDPERIAAVAAAGQRDFGENRAQELLSHARALGAEALGGAAAELRWHFVGRLQTNKVRLLAPVVSCWQSIDREELAPLLARHAPGAHVLVQVDLAGEPQKGGCTTAAAPGLVDALRGAGLAVDGLMTVPPAAGDPRPYFDDLRDLAARLGLPELSMGMSGDFEAAVEAGATIVRVGTAVFGPRPGTAAPPR